MSNNYYRVKIGTKYLTQNGLVSGRPCFLTVSNVDELRKTVHKTLTQLADGGFDVRNFDFDTVRKPFDIEVNAMPTATGEYLLNAYNNSTILTVIASGSEIGDFTVSAEIVDVQFKEWRTGMWKKVIIKLLTD